MTPRRRPRSEPSVLVRLAAATERQAWGEWADLFAAGATVTFPPADPMDVATAADLARSLPAAGITVRYEVIAEGMASGVETRRHRATFTSRTGSVTVEATAAARIQDGLITQLIEHVDLGPVIALATPSHPQTRRSPA